MAVFVATFRYGADASTLATSRAERFSYFRELEAAGVLLAFGQLTGGELGDGMLVLDAASLEVARELLDRDPFVRTGYVDHLAVAQWNPTTGVWLGE